MSDPKIILQVLQIIDDRRTSLMDDSYLLSQHQLASDSDIEMELEINRSQIALLEELYEEIKGIQ